MPGDEENEFQNHVWITTFSNRKFRLYGDDPNDISIVDIAHALSHQCRYTGHVRIFYSVAQHSCLVAHLVERMGGTLAEQRSALLHDASEAYLSDLAAPFKSEVEGYHKVERMIEARIEAKYRLPGKTEVVKKADWYALFIEADALINADASDWIGYDRYAKTALAYEIDLVAEPPIVARRKFFDYAVELGITE